MAANRAEKGGQMEKKGQQMRDKGSWMTEKGALMEAFQRVFVMVETGCFGRFYCLTREKNFPSEGVKILSCTTQKVTNMTNDSVMVSEKLAICAEK